ncbi:MAG TPA: hypothetical protein VFI31_03170 [Pirellulales bacterium]|nr:hypothetical protein [Pirellulales bacterium]
MTDIQPDPSELRERLVAYLDGELDGASARAVEKLVAREPQVERELRQLERAWQLLDRLPRAELDPSFTRSTVEMVALAVEEEQRPSASSGRLRAAQSLLVLTILAVAGFSAVRFWPDANHQLLRDLPILEHLEAYRQTSSIDFLRRLEKASLFADERVVTAPTPEATLTGIESLPAEQKTELHRDYERFVHLPPEEQRRLRTLHIEIESDERAAELTAVLVALQKWLKQLSGIERAELMALDADSRFERMARLRRDEARRLDAKDLQAFIAWAEGCLGRLAQQRPDAIKVRPNDVPPARRREMTARAAHELRLTHPFLFASAFNDPGARRELYDTLSPSGRRQLELAKAPEERRLLLQTWFAQAFSPQAMARAAQLQLPEEKQTELKRFFQTQLDPAQRAQLLNLPADQMQRQLRQRYEQWKRGKRSDGP